MYDYLIVGIGLFGSVFARCAADLGKKVMVIDKRNNIGGRLATYRYYAPSYRSGIDNSRKNHSCVNI